MSESESESTLSLDEVEINSKRGKNVKGIKKGDTTTAGRATRRRRPRVN